MDSISKIDKVREKIAAFRAAGKTVALVPTMGGLHRGHLRLVERAKKECDVVAMSIFVNARQFNNPDDLAAYPRDLEADKKRARDAGVDLLFNPSEEEMYPPGFLTTVNVSYLSNKLEGEFRPGHFRAVCTVVLKLLNIFQPDKLIMGLKDAQQFTIVQSMIDDLAIPTKLIGVPTVRDKDGLALSTRNQLLSTEEREKALAMNRALKRVHFLIRKQGILHTGELLNAARSAIETAGAQIDYAAIVNRSTLEPIEHVMRGGTFVLLAIRVGKVRLIDSTRI